MERAIELAELTDRALAEVSGGDSISEGMAEAKAKADTAMAAATTQMILGIVAGTAAIAGVASAFSAPSGKKHR